LGKDLGLAKGRLDRVSGGLDKPGSWKKDVSLESTLDQMKEPLNVLSGAYCDAIRSRIATVRKDLPDVARLRLENATLHH